MGRTRLHGIERYVRLFTVIVSTAVWLGASVAYALELPIGVKPNTPKRLIPRLRAAVTVGGDYSDNVNTAPGRNSKGVRLRVTPEVSLEMPDIGATLGGGKRLYLEGGYKYGFLGVDGRKIEFHSNTHLANAGLRYGLSPRASLGSKYVFQRDQYPFASAGDTFTLNDVKTQLKFQLTKRLVLEPYYNFQNFNDTGSDADQVARFQDYGDHRVGWDSNYTLSPKVSLIGHSEYQNRSFRDTDRKDFDSYGGQGGLAMQLTRKIWASGMGGYVRRYFDQGKDFGSAIWDVKLQYLPSRKVNANLFYNYTLEDTFVTGFTLDKLSPSVVDFIPRQYRAIVVQRIGAVLNLLLTEKDLLSSSFVYQFARATSGQDVSEEINRLARKLDENDYQFGVNYSHAFAEWLRFYLAYTNLGRNTNIADNFRANVLSFGVRLGW